MRIAIVELATKRIASIYEADAPKSYGGDWGRADLFAHVEIPAEITSNHITVDEDLTVTEDSQALRNNKLTVLRSLRNEKMKEVDIMVNDLAVGDRTDTTAVRNYRTALKDITSDHKYANDDNRGKASLDAFAEDMSDFTWPTKP